MSDCEYESEHESDVDVCMEEEVATPDSIDLDGDVNMERDSDDDEEEDEEEEDEEKEDEEVVDNKDEDEEEDKKEDGGKELQTIGQGEMVNTSADDVDTIVGNQPIMLPEQGAWRCTSIPYGHNIQCLPHHHKHRSLAHEHKLQRVIPSVGRSIWRM
jgi:hypothetical protein